MSAGKYKNKSYNLRINTETKLKMQIIAKREHLTLKDLYESIITKYLTEYEANHGEIEIEEEGGGH